MWLFLPVMAPIVGLYLFGPEVFNQGRFSTASV